VVPSAHSPLSSPHESHAVPSLKRHTPYSPPSASYKLSSMPPFSTQPVLAGFGIPIMAGVPSAGAVDSLVVVST